MKRVQDIPAENRLRYSAWTAELIAHSGLSVAKVADLTGFSTTTVMRLAQADSGYVLGNENTKHLVAVIRTAAPAAPFHHEEALNMMQLVQDVRSIRTGAVKSAIDRMNTPPEPTPPPTLADLALTLDQMSCTLLDMEAAALTVESICDWLTVQTLTMEEQHAIVQAVYRR